MQTKTIAVTALAMLIGAGCANQQTSDKAEPVAQAPAVKQEVTLMTGASANMLAFTCAGCHGTDGQSGGPATPTIAGLETDYFIEVMEAYKNGDRVNTIMGRIAQGYSEEEIEKMASFFAQRTYAGVTQIQAGDKAHLGRKLHDNYCEKCHENGGTSVEDTPLVGQWMPYMQWTIADYLDGHNHPEKKMKKAVDKMLAEHPHMSKAELTESLAHYYASHNQ